MDLMEKFKIGDSIKFSHWFYTQNKIIEVKVLYTISTNDEQYVKLGPFPNGVKEKVFKASTLMYHCNAEIPFLKNRSD